MTKPQESYDNAPFTCSPHDTCGLDAPRHPTTPASAGADLRSHPKLVALVRPNERCSHLRSHIRIDRCLCRDLQVTGQAKVASGRSVAWGFDRSCSRLLGRVWHLHSHAHPTC